MAITVVCPSRGRPGKARRLIGAIRETAVLSSTTLILAVDADDPTLPEYRTMLDYLPPPRVGSERRPTLIVLDKSETGNLVRATNTVSMRVAEASPDDVIANFGDDHRPKTGGWDRAVTQALATPGIAYGDDLLQGEALPTAPFISAQIVLALGWYALPILTHLFVDNVWRDVGAQTGTLRYLPEVIIEHQHPLANKAIWDEGYFRANSQETIDRDRIAYERWRETDMAVDIERVRQALTVAA